MGVVESLVDKPGGAFADDNLDKQKKKVSSEVGFYNAKTISRLGPGNFFGEGCIFPEIRRDWIVEAMSEVKLYFISRGDIMNNVDKVRMLFCFRFVPVQRTICTLASLPFPTLPLPISA